jgi:hypothetical protein
MITFSVFLVITFSTQQLRMLLQVFLGIWQYFPSFVSAITNQIFKYILPALNAKVLPLLSFMLIIE